RRTVSELVDMGLASLAEIFDLSLDRMTRDLVTSQAINWGNDPFARGAYSYATPGAAKTGWWRRILFWRSAVCRPGYGHGRGGAGQRTGDGPDDPGRRTIGVPGNNIAPLLGMTATRSRNRAARSRLDVGS